MRNINDKIKTEDISVRFGVVCYRDHPPEETTYLLRIQDLTTDEKAMSFVGK
jgi:hypothetical protein